MQIHADMTDGALGIFGLRVVVELIFILVGIEEGM